MKPTNQTESPETTTEPTTPETRPTETSPPPDEPIPTPDPLTTLRTENETLRAALRLRDARDQVTSALASAGARSPELLFEASKSSLRFDDEGRLRPVDSLLKTLQTKYPEQFTSEPVIPPSIDAGTGTASATSSLSKEALSKMSPTEIAKLDWAEVRRALTER